MVGDPGGGAGRAAARGHRPPARSRARPRAADHLRDRRDRDRRLAHAGAGRASSASSATPATRRRTSASRCRRQPSQPTPLAPGGLMGAYVNRQPVGAVACISPYNFPLTNIGGQDRARARGRVHGRDEARAAGPARDPRARRDHARGRLPAGRRQRRHVGRAGARRPRSPSPATSTWSRSPARPRSAQQIYEAGGRTMKRLLLELGGKGAAVGARRRRPRRSRSPPSAACGRSTAARSAPRRRVRSCTAAATTSWSSGSPAMAGDAEGGRPARRGHDRRTGHLGAPSATASRRYVAAGRDEGAEHRRRRASPAAPRRGLLRRADAARRVHAPT